MVLSSQMPPFSYTRLSGKIKNNDNPVQEWEKPMKDKKRAQQQFCKNNCVKDPFINTPAIAITDRKIILSKRIAIGIFFFVNGFLYANWTARLPELKAFYDISNGTLGTLLFTTAAGALVSMPIAGWITGKYNNEMLTVLAGILFCSVIPLIPLSNDLWVARSCFFATGFFSGAMDVTMNGQAVLVEREWKKPIMSSFHALFSIGMAIGAGVSALFSRFHIILPAHFLVVSLAAIAAILSCARIIIRDPVALPLSITDKNSGTFRLPALAILPLGIIAFCGMTGEGAMADWSAIYMHTVVGSTESFSALAFGVFGAAMTIGRIFGDRLTAALGKNTLLLLDVAVAITGLSLSLLFPYAWVSMIGFFMVGIGLATIVPIIYSTAGNTPGVSPSAGIAMASTIGYMGFFVGPPMIGHLADIFGLRTGLAYVVGLFIVMGVLIIYTGKKQQRS